MSGLILVHDYETTGLTLHPDADLRKQPQAIEFGGVLLDSETGEIVEEDGFLINPGVRLTPEIVKITGITDADLQGAPSFREVLPRLRRMYAAADCLVSHNLPFDRAILRGELLRFAVRDFVWPRLEVCTVGLYREQWGKNPKLLELYEAILGKPLAQTHRALDDVKALVEIIQAERLFEVMR